MADVVKGAVFDDHGDLARWLGNELTIFVGDEPRTCRDLLLWDAGRLFRALAGHELYRAVPAPEPAAPRCPCCGSDRAWRRDVDPWWLCAACDCKWDEDKRAPCPECQELRDLMKAEEEYYCSGRDRWRLRAEAAEKALGDAKRALCGPSTVNIVTGNVQSGGSHT